MSTLVASAPVEVKCLETFAYYPAKLKDYDPKSNTVLIEYENHWKADEWFSLENVRPAAPAFDQATFNPTAGQQIEAMAKSSDEEPYSWWKASIKNVKGEFYLISYSSWEDEFNEILEKEMLRPLNSSPAFSAQPAIVKQEIPLPKDLRTGLDVNHFQPIVHSSQALAINVNLEPKNNIVILGSAAAVKRATALLAIALKHLVDIHKLQQRKLQHEATIDSLKSKIHDTHVEEFRLNPVLMGLVIGKKGANIKKAEEEKNVISVRVDSEKGLVVIQAKTAEDAARARKHLDFIEESYPIPRNSVGRIVGKSFTNIQEIEKNSGVIRIRVADEKERKSKDSASAELLITGQRETVEMAKMLLDHHIKFLDQLSELSEQERKLSQMAIEDDAPSFSGRGGGSMRGRGGRGRGRGRGGFVPRNAEESRSRQADSQSHDQPKEESRHPFQRPANNGERKSRPQSAFQAAKAESAISAAAQAADDEVKYERKPNQKGKNANQSQQKDQSQQQQQPKAENQQKEKKEEKKDEQKQQQPKEKKEKKEKQPKKEEKKDEAAKDEKSAEAEKKDEKAQSRPQTARNKNQKKNPNQNQQQPTSAAAAVAAASTADSAANAAKAAEGDQKQAQAQAQAQTPKDGEKKQNNRNRRQNQNPNQKKQNGDAAAAQPESAHAAASQAQEPKKDEKKEEKKDGADAAKSPQNQNRRGNRREKHPASDVPAAEKKDEPQSEKAADAAAAPSQEKKENGNQKKQKQQKKNEAPAAAPANAAAAAPAAESAKQ